MLLKFISQVNTPPPQKFMGIAHFACFTDSQAKFHHNSQAYVFFLSSRISMPVCAFMAWLRRLRASFSPAGFFFAPYFYRLPTAGQQTISVALLVTKLQKSSRNSILRLFGTCWDMLRHVVTVPRRTVLLAC